MEFSTLPSSKLLIFTLISIAIFSFSTHSGHAEEEEEEYHNPRDVFEKALFCFNNRFIHSGCNEAYGLQETGNIDVPVEATDSFCSGPCFAQTQYVLNCIDAVLSDFVFDNKATIRNVRNALHDGCSHTDHRGNFDVRRYIEGEYISHGQKVHNVNMVACISIIFFLHLVIH